MKNIAVIGGGASGLVAALFASNATNRVTLFEKQNKIGRKLLVTGNGRCNLSNQSIDVTNYHGKNPDFAMKVLSRFGLNDTIKYFQSIGIPLTEGNDGKLFPESLHAGTVAKVLEYELLHKGIDLKLHRKVEKILPISKGIKIITSGKEESVFDSCILSTGSCAHPQLGASRIGYELASALGHSIVELFPSILPINIPLKILHRLEGLRWESKIEVEMDNKIVKKSNGELLFTKYGISGPASLNASRAVNELITSGQSPYILIDFFPNLTCDELSKKLESLWIDKKREISFSLLGIMRERISRTLVAIAGIDPQKSVGKLTNIEKEKLVKVFKSLRLVPGKPRSFNDAVVAAGGIHTDEIDPNTMESKIVKNLYITGELLDIDGDSGGYNLQFAWSTGAIAGMSQ